MKIFRNRFVCRLFFAGSVFSYFVCPAYSESKDSKSEQQDIIDQVQNWLNGLTCMTSSFAQATGTTVDYIGKIWLLKKNNSTKVKIKYQNKNQEILIQDQSIRIDDLDSKKKYTYSISQTPIYKVLTGNINLKKESYDIIENSNEFVRIRINKASVFGGASVTLVFSKYASTGQLKYMVAWVIDDGKTETLVSLDLDTLTINDESKIPNKIFG